MTVLGWPWGGAVREAGTDLLAESHIAQARATTAEAAVYKPLLPHPLPDQRQPDTLVFGDWSPRQDPAGTVGPRRLCAEHDGVQWHGVGDCFVCETASRG